MVWSTVGLLRECVNNNFEGAVVVPSDGACGDICKHHAFQQYAHLFASVVITEFHLTQTYASLPIDRPSYVLLMI